MKIEGFFMIIFSSQKKKADHPGDISYYIFNRQY